MALIEFIGIILGGLIIFAKVVLAGHQDYKQRTKPKDDGQTEK